MSRYCSRDDCAVCLGMGTILVELIVNSECEKCVEFAAKIGETCIDVNTSLEALARAYHKIHKIIKKEEKFVALLEEMRKLQPSAREIVENAHLIDQVELKKLCDYYYELENPYMYVLENINENYRKYSEGISILLLNKRAIIAASTGHSHTVTIPTRKCNFDYFNIKNYKNKEKWESLVKSHMDTLYNFNKTPFIIVNKLLNVSTLRLCC